MSKVKDTSQILYLIKGDNIYYEMYKDITNGVIIMCELG